MLFAGRSGGLEMQAGETLTVFPTKEHQGTLVDEVPRMLVPIDRLQRFPDSRFNGESEFLLKPDYYQFGTVSAGVPRRLRGMKSPNAGHRGKFGRFPKRVRPSLTVFDWFYRRPNQIGLSPILP